MFDLKKKITATHEAGHAALILCTPLRDHVLHAKIFKESGEWRGEVATDSGAIDTALLDQDFAFDAAKGLAGPLVELQKYRDSVHLDLQAYLDSEHGVIGAFRRIVREKSTVEFRWHSDLVRWISLCSGLSHAPLLLDQEEAFYRKIELSVSAFLAQPSVIDLVDRITNRLLVEEYLPKIELHAIPVDRVPLFIAPP